MLNRVLCTGFLYLHALLKVCVIFRDEKDKSVAIESEGPLNQAKTSDNLVLHRWGIKFDHATP